MAAKLLLSAMEPSFDGAHTDSLRRRDVGNGLSLEMDGFEQSELRNRESCRRTSDDQLPRLGQIGTVTMRRLRQHLIERLSRLAPKVVREDVAGNRCRPREGLAGNAVGMPLRTARS